MDNFEEFGKRIDEEVARLKRMNNFEEFGKRVDEELKRVKSFVKEDVAPETEKRTAQFLREVSEKLKEAAAWIEARNAARRAQNTDNPQDSQNTRTPPAS
jgi:gentisate 1,2-dioxygenase